MGSAAKAMIRWTYNRGRNGNDLPGDILPDQVAEAFNVVIGASAIGQRRKGTAAQTLTGDSFSGFSALARFIAGQDDTAAQLFIVSRDATVKVLRVTGGSAATNLSLISAILNTRPQDCSTATLNGKLYVAIRLASNVNRMLVYDPGYSTTAIRYVGMGTPAAPTAADTGAGGPAATLRYYRVAYQEQRAGVIIRQSLYGASVSRTNTAGSQTRVTRPSTLSPSEGETHWVVAGSADGSNYYALATIAIGTTTYDDAADPATYSSANASFAVPSEGANTPWPAVKFIGSDGNRLVGFGAWEPGVAVATPTAMVTKDGRFFFSPVLDSSTIHDDERVSNTTTFQGWIDISRNGGSEDRALMGPIDGQWICAFSRGMTILSPTGDAQAPYRKRSLSSSLGAVSNVSWFIGEDENGAPCIYWLDPKRGPYRYGRGGLQWCGYDVMDLWETVNLSASGVVAHGQWNDETKSCEWSLALGSSTAPGNAAGDRRIVFHVQEGRPVKDENGVIGVRDGWAVWTMASGSEACSVAFPTTFAAAMSRRWSIYSGNASALLRSQDASTNQDNGSNFQSYVTSRAWDMGREHQDKRLGKSYVLADAASGVTITQTLNRNYGQESRATTAVLTAGGSETQVLKKFEAAELMDAYTFQTTLGDGSAQNVGWVLHNWYATYEVTENER